MTIVADDTLVLDGNRPMVASDLEKIHYAHPDSVPPNFKSFCRNKSDSRMSINTDDVTCSACLAKLKKWYG